MKAMQLRWPLETLHDLDRAVYRYMGMVSKSNGELLVCALFRAFPGTRRNLPLAQARMAAGSIAPPPVHHQPLPWLTAVHLAYALSRMGRPRREAFQLLQ